MDSVKAKGPLSLCAFIALGLFLFIIRTPSYNTVYYKPGHLHTTRKPHERVDRNKAYLVDTTNCRIVRWPTFDAQTLPLYVNRTDDQIECKIGEISIERSNFSAIRVINNLNKQIKCFKRDISRESGTDDSIYYSNYTAFDPTIEQQLTSQLIKVSCTIEDNHAFEKVIPLIPELRADTTPDDNLPNVLFVGIDSISRLNFERHFPIASQLLSKHNFYTMFGYNKVADNTFVNLTPLLTGRYLDDLWNETMSKTVFYNYFPFIWKQFKSKGYKTLLMEDAPQMATFNYLKNGFLEAPTDYYLRPYALATEQFVKDDCYLDKPEIETYYDYVYDFVEAMDKRRQKYFAFTFMARLSHNDLNSAGLVDPMVSRLISRLFDNKLMSNTLLVFFSDHGIRFGDIRRTLSGKIEERMPFMHLYVPHKWQNHNISVNQNRLTTPFDIHATLKHIIDGKPDTNLKYGKSLLEEIPEQRSCATIPVLEHWCSCQSSEPIKDLSKVEPISQFITTTINQLIAKENFSAVCSNLTLERTVSAFEQHLSDSVLKFESSHNDVIGRQVSYGNKTAEIVKHFLVTIKVKPSDALLEATVNYNKRTQSMQIIGEVSRINFYGNQSDCIDNQFVRRYCFCKTHDIAS